VSENSRLADEKKPRTVAAILLFFSDGHVLPDLGHDLRSGYLVDAGVMRAHLHGAMS
jgi:hypothetical protein